MRKSLYWSLASAAALGMLTWACGAVGAPTSSKPGAARKARAPAVPAAPAAAIGAANAERVKLVWEADAGERGRAVALERRSARLAAATGTPVVLYELGTGKRIGELPSCSDVVRGGLGFFRTKLVVVCESGLELHDAVKRVKLAAPRIASARVTAAAIVGNRIALGHRDGVVRIYSLEGAPTLEIAVPGPPIDVKSLDLTRDGARVAVAWVQGSIWWWNTAQPALSYDLVRHDSESDAVEFSDDGSLFAEEGRSSYTTVWAFSDKPVEKARLRNGAWIKRIRFTRDARWLARGGSDGLELAELAGPKRVVLDTRGAVEDVVFDELGVGLAAIDRDGRVTLWAAR